MNFAHVFYAWTSIFFSILLFVESSSSKDQIKHFSFFFLSNCYACILYLHLYPHSANENIFIIAMRSVIFSTSTKIKLKYCMANAWVITGEERKKTKHFTQLRQMIQLHLNAIFHSIYLQLTRKYHSGGSKRSINHDSFISFKTSLISAYSDDDVDTLKCYFQ